MSSKTLFIVRHAKSSWKDQSLSDIDRPLNQRGRRDAPEMGRRLQLRRVSVGVLISSPAVRAVRTAEAIAGKIRYPVRRIVTDDLLYGATEEDILDLVSSLEGTLNTAMLVSHNPVLTDLANCFSTDVIDNVPTCGILEIQAPAWSDFRRHGQLVTFDYPKNVSADFGDQSS